MKKTIAAVALGVMANSALAEGYASFSYALFETELTSGIASVDFDTPTVQLALGSQFNDYFSAEVRAGFAAGDDSSFNLDVEISDYLAVYLKPTLPIFDDLHAYLLLGTARTTVDTSVGEDDDSDFSYGIGFAAKAGETVNLFAEYISLYDDSDDGVDVEISGFNIGLAFEF